MLFCRKNYGAAGMAIERTISIIKPDAVAKKRHW